MSCHDIPCAHSTWLTNNSISNIEVSQEGQERIMPVVSFETAGLHPAMLENIKLAGFTRITPIQSYVLPAIHSMFLCFPIRFDIG